MKRLAATLLGALALTVVFTSTAPAATVVGQTFVPDELYSDDFTTIQSGSPAGQYTVPADGVLTSWSFLASTVGVPQGLKLKVARPGGGSTFTTVGESAPKNPSPGQLNTFTDVSIAVRTGDVLGLYTGSVDLVRIYRDVIPAAGYVDLELEGDTPLNAPLAFDGPFDDVQIDVSATVEPDCDGDGLGDETEDDLLVGGSCPIPTGRALTLDANRNLVKKGKRVTLSGRLDAPADLTACESGQQVEIARKAKGQSSLAPVAQATTGADGSFSAKLKVRKASEYRATVAQQGQCGPGTSDSEKVAVKKPKK